MLTLGRWQSEKRGAALSFGGFPTLCSASCRTAYFCSKMLRRWLRKLPPPLLTWATASTSNFHYHWYWLLKWSDAAHSLIDLNFPHFSYYWTTAARFAVFLWSSNFLFHISCAPIGNRSLSSSSCCHLTRMIFHLNFLLAFERTRCYLAACDPSTFISECDCHFFRRCGSVASCLASRLRGFTKTARAWAKDFSYPVSPFRVKGLVLFSGRLSVATWWSCQRKS